MVGYSRSFASRWSQAGGRGLLVRFVVLTLIFCTVSIWSVWPMPQVLNSQIPTSADGIATVPLFNAWTIAWNAHSATRGMQGYWDAPIFHPVKGTFALSEPQPATLVVAPAIWWLRSPAVAYNVYMLLSLTLNGLFTVYLMRTLRAGWIASMIAGVAMIQHPLVHLQIEVIQLMPVWGILWTFAALIRLREFSILSSLQSQQIPEGKDGPHKPHLRMVVLCGIETGVAFVAVSAASIHHGLFLSLLLAATGLLIVPWRHLAKWIPGVVVAALIAAGLLLPLLLPISRVMHEHSFKRSESLVAQLSIKPTDYLVEPSSAILKWHMVSGERRWPLSVGWMRTALALCAVCVSVFSRNRSCSFGIWFLVAVAFTAFLLSQGVNFQLGKWNVWTTLCEYVPGVSQVRSAFRFAYFVQIVVIVLAASGFDWLYTMGRNHSCDRISVQWIKGAVLLAIACLTMFEIPPPTIHLVGVPQLTQAQWKNYVKSHLKNNHGVLLMPYVRGAMVRDFDITTRWMLSMVLDDIPVINGYSGFFPESHFHLQRAIEADPYSDETLQLLDQAKIQFLIIHSRTPEDLPLSETTKFTLAEVPVDGSEEIQILELRRRKE